MESKRYTKLAEFAKELLSHHSIEKGLPLISEYLKEVIGADRCSIFIVDNVKNELWTTHADGVERIIVPRDKGIVGHTLDVKKPVIVNDAYSDEHFLQEIDKKTGYKTKNIVAVPIFDSHRNIIGVLELLNKEAGFDNEDVKFMIFFAHYVSGFLELITTLGEK